MSPNGSDWDLEFPEPYDVRWNDYVTATLVTRSLLPFIIVIGLVLNLVVVVAVFKGRLWSQRGGRVYLVAVFVTNLVTLVLCILPFWISEMDHSLSIVSSSKVTCHLWPFLEYSIITVSHWILTVLMMNTYSLNSSTHLVPRCHLPGTPTTRAIVVVMIIVVAAMIINLWLPCHPEALQYDGYCHYSTEWFINNSVKLVAWRFFLEYLPLYILTPVFWILTVYKRRVHSRVPFVSLDRPETEVNEVTREFTNLSLGVAAVMLLLILPISINQLIHLISYSNDRLFLPLSVLVVVSESHLAFVPAASLAVSPSMRKVMRREILPRSCWPRCPHRCLGSSDGADDDGIPLDSSAENGDNSSANLQTEFPQ